MNINMNVGKKELNTLFEVILKNALANDVTLNLNINLEDCETPVKTHDNYVVPSKVAKNNKPSVTLGKCNECNTIQAVNLIEGEKPTCYVCSKELSTELRNFKHLCTCGNHINVDIVGTGVAYVSCNQCNKKHNVELDYNKNTWVLKRNIF